MELGQAGGWEAVCRAHLCVLDLEPCPLLGKQGPGGKWASFCRTPQEDPRERGGGAWRQAGAIPARVWLLLANPRAPGRLGAFV